MTSPAFLALWNGVAPGREREYEIWHGIEHVPERLGAPGFRAAHRYRAEEGHDYFTLYELDGLEALDTPAYGALVREPTPWSARMRPALTGFRRLPCRTLLAHRFGQGGAVATLRIQAEGQDVLSRLRPELEHALQAGKIFGFTLGAASGIGEAYAAFPGAPVPDVETLLSVNAGEPAALPPIINTCQQTFSGLTSEVGYWRLLQSLRRDELIDPLAARQAPREDLRSRWSRLSQD
jgi:hypothetical protein